MDPNNDYYKSKLEEIDILKIFNDFEEEKSNINLKKNDNDSIFITNNTIQYDYKKKEYNSLHLENFTSIIELPNRKNILPKEKKHVCSSRCIHKYNFTCSYCQKKFKSKKELTNHVDRQHICLIKYYCPDPFCPKAYTTKDSYRLHVKRNHGEKKYKCKECDIFYGVNGDLNLHILRKHTTDKNVLMH